MCKNKTILIAILLIIFFFSGIFLNANAEEQKPETPTAEAQLNTEEISPQPPKSPKKGSVPKKEKTKNNNKNSTDAHKKNENENTNAKNKENKEKSESEKQKEIPKPKKEEKNLDLPNVNNSEVELNPYFSQISQNTQEKSILKTLISWGLILVGIILILKVIISNRKIPKNYTINKKNKHSAISHKGNHVNYKL